MLKLFALVFVLQCTYSYGFSLQPRIINGEPSNPEDFPFYVYLDLKDSFGSKCGGSLISNEWILTAAHCVRPINRNSYSRIRAYVPGGGSDNYSVIPIENQFLYPNAVVGDWFHDIGLLKLPTPIESHPFVAPIKLNTVCNENFDNEYVTVAGRGLQSIEYQQPDQQIRHVQLQVLPYDECVARTDQYPADTLICALPNEGRSVYSGDSGGPLVRKRDGTLIGVVHGVNIDHKRSPAEGKIYLTKYTRIDYYFNWIANVTGISLPECGPSSPPPNKEDVGLVERILRAQAARAKRKQEKALKEATSN